MANANGGGYSRDRTVLPFVDPDKRLSFGRRHAVGRRLINNWRTKLRNEKINK
jgi:hypothetical protein